MAGGRIFSVPILPVLSAAELAGGAAAVGHSLLDVGAGVVLDSGTTAIRAALSLAGVGGGDVVLVPAFHCPAMVEPAVDLGATPAFYGVEADLAIDVAAIEKAWTPRARAVIVPHLLGRIQRLRAIREYCDAKGLALIEDCAHSFFGSLDSVAVGTTGHFAIGSPRKFLPIVEGGLITSAERSVDAAAPRRPSMFRTARTAFDMIDLANRYGRLRAMSPMLQAVKMLRRVPGSGADVVPAGGAAAPAARRPAEIAAATWVTRAMLRRSMTGAAIARRRENFAYLSSGLRGAASVAVLDVSQPGADVVPYMVPALLRDPERNYPALRAAGVPLWRWEHSRRGVCAVTDDYATRLIQIPCHQSLTRSDLDGMLERLTDVGRQGGSSK